VSVGPAAAATVTAIAQDFPGGHIRGALNVPSHSLTEKGVLDGLIDGALANKSRVIVHCMLSQVRGPRAAAQLAARLSERGCTQPAVLVMEGGWSKFGRIYGSDAALVEHGGDSGPSS